jgi:hypothetical protein
MKTLNSLEGFVPLKQEGRTPRSVFLPLLLVEVVTLNGVLGVDICSDGTGWVS